jgi:hypothetical protein
MSRGGIRVDTAALTARVTALEHALQGRISAATAEIREAVIETAIETANALADRTFPKGYGFKLAKAQMAVELKALYATGGRVYAALEEAGEKQIATGFYRAYKSGNLTGAQSILRQSSTAWANIPVGRLDPGLHERARSAQTGQIEVSHPRQIVPKEDLEYYQTIAIKRLGKTASGWNACAEQLGGNGNKPKWKGTAIHGPDGGSVSEEHSINGYTVVMTNLRKLARKHLSPGQKNTILRKARRNLQDRLVKGAVTKIVRRRRAA